MAKFQLCLSALVCLFVLVHPFSAAELVGRKFQQNGQSLLSSAGARGVRGHLVPLAPSTTNVSARVAEDVRSSQARLEFLSGVGAGFRLLDSRSPVSAVPGGYAMIIQIGSPAQTFTAVADTGSDLIWVQCKPCTQCFTQPDALFDPSKSSTYSTLSCSNPFCQDLRTQHSCDSNKTCNYQYLYGDQSTTNGPLSVDTIKLSGTPIPSVAFGCGTNNQGTFNSIDGLVGLGLGPLSLPSQLSTSVGHKFSYCLASSSGPSKSSPIVFGDSAVPTAQGLVYTPLVPNSFYPTFYYVTLKDVNVGGKQLNIPSSVFAIDPSSGTGGVMFDSGTTITQLAPAGHDAVKKALQATVSYPLADGTHVGLDLCFDLSAVSNPQFPAVTFNFDGADLLLPTENTFVAIDQQGKTVCLAMGVAYLELSIFGNIQQRGFQIVYDVEKTMLGWVPSQC